MVDTDSDGWENWQWDPTLFSGTAAHYVRGRLPYAPGLADVLREALSLEGRGRLLDVGCGPGVIALQLAELFDQVIGLDPDPDMLAEASREATRQAVSNAQWVNLRAEDLPGKLGDFRVVAFAASFHWMDRQTVARAVHSMLEPNGAVIQIHAPAYEPDPGSTTTIHPPPPTQAIDELRQRYLGPNRRAGQSIRTSSPDREDDVFTAAGFASGMTITVPDGRAIIRTTDDLVAQTLSMSSTAPHLFGDQLADFEADLRTVLAAASPSNQFMVVLPDNIVTVWRLPQT